MLGPGADARTLHKGSYGGWLTKAKSESTAAARWFTGGTTKRFFTIDYDMQIMFYSHSQERKKDIAADPLQGHCVGRADTKG